MTKFLVSYEDPCYKDSRNPNEETTGDEKVDSIISYGKNLYKELDGDCRSKIVSYITIRTKLMHRTPNWTELRGKKIVNLETVKGKDPNRSTEREIKESMWRRTE